MSRHTPGPWKIHADINVESVSGRFIASCGINSNVTNELPESMANATLIAVAPELLETCKESLRLMDNHGPAGNLTEHQQESWRQNVSDLKNLISRAEGKEIK